MRRRARGAWRRRRACRQCRGTRLQVCGQAGGVARSKHAQQHGRPANKSAMGSGRAHTQTLRTDGDGMEARGDGAAPQQARHGCVEAGVGGGRRRRRCRRATGGRGRRLDWHAILPSRLSDSRRAGLGALVSHRSCRRCAAGVAGGQHASGDKGLNPPLGFGVERASAGLQQPLALQRRPHRRHSCVNCVAANWSCCGCRRDAGGRRARRSY